MLQKDVLNGEFITGVPKDPTDGRVHRPKHSPQLARHRSDKQADLPEGLGIPRIAHPGPEATPEKAGQMAFEENMIY